MGVRQMALLVPTLLLSSGEKGSHLSLVAIASGHSDTRR